MRFMTIAMLTLSMALASPATSVNAQDDGREKVLAFLDGLRSLSGRYRQINPDGSEQSGKIYLKRPDKVHFEEDADEGNWIIASGFWVAIIDKASGHAAWYPTDSLPIAALLSEDPLADERIEITAVQQYGDVYRLSVISSESPELGELTLVVGGEPMELLGWSVVDAQNTITNVRLITDSVNVDIDDELFQIHRYEQTAGERQ